MLRSRRIHVMGALVAAFLTGCATDATAPTDPSPTFRKQSTATASTITIWAENGDAYTLDPSALEIRASNGVAIELYPEDLPAAVTAFVAIHDGDALLTSTQNSPPPPPSPSECGLEKCPATGDMNVMVGGFSVSATPALSVSPPADPGPKGRFPKWNGKTYPTSIILKRSHSPPERNIGRMQTDLAPSVITGLEISPYLVVNGWNCSQIYGAIVGSFPTYLASRLDAVTLLGAVAASAARFENGRLVVKRPNVERLLVQLGAAATSAMIDKTAMAFMVTMYNSYGCHQIFVGGFNGGSLGGGLRLVCSPQTWIISGDGGSTWQEVKVSLCEFRLA